jgi:hypothetical protein
MTDNDCPHCGRWIPTDMLADPLDHSTCIQRVPCAPKPQGQAWPERDDRELEEVKP